MTREEAIFCEKSYIGETNCVDCKYYGTDTCQSRESHRMAIKALEQEPKTGHWIESRCDMYECSECDYVYTDLSCERYGMHYCPNCGAKMVKPQESEDNK